MIICVARIIDELTSSMTLDELVQLERDLLDLPDGVCPDQDDSHYVITNGPAFLTMFQLVGRSHRYEFGRKGAILFDNEAEALMVLSLLCGLTTWDFSIDRSDWMVKKLTKVKVRVKS